ncbi:MAG: patatin-like phospholipase family protein, partial [Pseudomonadota bacterium]
MFTKVDEVLPKKVNANFVLKTLETYLMPNDTNQPSKPYPPTRAGKPPRLGLALGSGGAKGWAHVGVLKALDELGIEADVYAGCSAGALVSGAKLLGILDELKEWAMNIGPMGAVTAFGVQLSRGGLINPDKAFGQFARYDLPIETLSSPWGAVATDLATGLEVWLTEGSTLNACRASSAVPLVLQAASHTIDDDEHWLIDGGVANPVPVNLARALGADR